jgi:hypothetical protein
VGGDERVREAHRESVGIALDELERFVQARMGGNNPAETTGKWQTLVVSPDNRFRQEINGRIHRELQSSGRVEEQEHSSPCLCHARR